MVEVEFVQENDAGLLILHDEARDLAILHADAFCAIHHEQTKIRPADGFGGLHGAEGFHRILDLRFSAQPGGVHQGVILARHRTRDVDGVPGCAGYFTDDGALLAQDGVNQGGLAGIWLAHDGDTKGFLGLGGCGLALVTFG